MVCRGHLQRRMVLVHSDLSWRAPSNSASARSSVAVAFAHFILRLRLHCDYAHIFSGRTGESLGIVSRFLCDARADLTPNIFTLSLRGRGIMWAISASICPIASLLLLMFAPRSTVMSAEWLAVFVGVVGIAFGIFTALMLSWLIAKPIDQMRAAADAVSRGNLHVDVGPAGAARADEFGRLLSEFDQMVRQLREKEKIASDFRLARRQTRRRTNPGARPRIERRSNKRSRSCSWICVHGQRAPACLLRPT